MYSKVAICVKYKEEEYISDYQDIDGDDQKFINLMKTVNRGDCDFEIISHNKHYFFNSHILKKCILSLVYK